MLQYHYPNFKYLSEIALAVSVNAGSLCRSISGPQVFPKDFLHCAEVPTRLDLLSSVCFKLGPSNEDNLVMLCTLSSECAK